MVGACFHVSDVFAFGWLVVAGSVRRPRASLPPQCGCGRSERQSERRRTVPCASSKRRRIAGDSNRPDFFFAAGLPGFCPSGPPAPRWTPGGNRRRRRAAPSSGARDPMPAARDAPRYGPVFSAGELSRKAPSRRPAGNRARKASIRLDSCDREMRAASQACPAVGAAAGGPEISQKFRAPPGRGRRRSAPGAALQPRRVAQNLAALRKPASPQQRGAPTCECRMMYYICDFVTELPYVVQSYRRLMPSLGFASAKRGMAGPSRPCAISDCASRPAPRARRDSTPAAPSGRRWKSFVRSLQLRALRKRFEQGLQPCAE